MSYHFAGRALLNIWEAEAGRKVQTHQTRTQRQELKLLDRALTYTVDTLSM